MNRRSFLKAMAGAAASTFVVPELIVPERRVFALDRTMMANRDARFLQRCIDEGLPIPPSAYHPNVPLVVGPHSKGIDMSNTRIEADHAGIVLEFVRKPDWRRDRIFSSFIGSSHVNKERPRMDLDGVLQGWNVTMLDNTFR